MFKALRRLPTAIRIKFKLCSWPAGLTCSQPHLPPLSSNHTGLFVFQTCQLVPASGPLYLLFPLPRMLFLLASSLRTNVTSFQTPSPLTLLTQQTLPRFTFFIALIIYLHVCIFIYGLSSIRMRMPQKTRSACLVCPSASTSRTLPGTE